MTVFLRGFSIYLRFGKLQFSMFRMSDYVWLREKEEKELKKRKNIDLLHEHEEELVYLDQDFAFLAERLIAIEDTLERNGMEVRASYDMYGYGPEDDDDQLFLDYGDVLPKEAVS